MSKPVIHPVTCCAECPFVSGESQPWVCFADESDAGRVIGEVRSPWPPVPDWCPLWEADRLVTLRVR